MCQGKRQNCDNPIIDWTREDVWYFLNEVVKVEHCELYDKGWQRIGCLFCPMASQKEIIKQGGVSTLQGFNITYHTPIKRKRLYESLYRPNRRRSF